MTTLLAQPDLFGEDDAAHGTRLADAYTCLIEACPGTCEIVIGVRRLDQGDIKVGKSGRWAYSLRSPGMHFEHTSTWGGWYSKPRNLLTWDELDEAIARDPRIDEVRAWSDSLTAVDAWRDRTRPFELWPDPGSWHPSYIAGDHARPGWAARLAAWVTVLDVLRDARKAVTA